MAELRPFGALRFTKQAGEITELTCPPYDIISEEEREAYLSTNPHNIIRLELPREGGDPYAEAGKTLRAWQDEGVLACDGCPGLYIYEEEFTVPGIGVQKGLKGVIGRVRLEEWEKGVVLPHEETLSKAKTDRLNLMKATGCNFSSIYSLYFDPQNRIVSHIERLSADAPDVEFRSGDGITHRVWAVTGAEDIAAVAGGFTDCKLYIADGHHRYETALNYRESLREQGSITDSEHPANFIMMMLVNIESPGLVVFPTHRIVHGLAAFDAAALLDGCKRYFDIEAVGETDFQARLDVCSTLGRKAFVFMHKGGMRLLVLRDEAVMDELLPGTSSAYRGLDVNILHSLILERLLGIDRENMASQKNLRYTRSPAEAIDAVREGSANCAFLINATRVDEIADVAGAGEKMPQKSTYFYPKLITGHVMNKMLDV